MSARLSFLGLTLHPHVRKSLPFLNSLSSQQRRTLLKLVNDFLLNKDIWNELSDAPIGLSPHDRDIVFAGTSKIFSLAIQQKVNVVHFKEDLLELKVLQAAIDDMSTVLSKCREYVEKHLIETKVRLPSMSSLVWRVDVEISTNNMSRVMQPTVHFIMTSSDNVIRQFSVPLNQFHNLRYCVAKGLKELDDISQLQIMKIPKTRK